MKDQIKPHELSRRDFNNLAIKVGIPAFLLALVQEACGISVDLQNPTATSAAAPATEVISLPFFEISGVPQSISHNDLLKWTERTPEPGDEPHTNSIGFGTEAFLAEPGVRTVDSAAEEDQSAWSTTHSDVQKVFEQPGPSYWGIPEGGFVMLTAAQMEITFNGVNAPINVKLGAEENHDWIVIVRGLSRDYQTPVDFNNQLEIDNYNPSFIMGTRLPPGQWVSEDYFEQNVATAHTTKNCGMDGCRKVSALFVDPDGAFTVIQQKGNGPWSQYATNIK